MLIKPLVTAKELKAVYSQCFDLRGNFEEQEMHREIQELNGFLKKAQLAIKSRMCEDSNEECYALISLIENEAAKYASEFTLLELELLKCILKEIVASENGTVSSIDCINYSSNIQKLSKSDAQKALEHYISSQWLKERDGEVSLTVRSLLELEPILRKIDHDLLDCKLCGQLIIKGAVCVSCRGKFHRHCLSKIAKGNQGLKCPGCRQPWTNMSSSCVGLNVTDSTASQFQRRESARNDRSCRKKRQIESDSDSD